MITFSGTFDDGTLYSGFWADADNWQAQTAFAFPIVVPGALYTPQTARAARDGDILTFTIGPEVKPPPVASEDWQELVCDASVCQETFIEDHQLTAVSRGSVVPLPSMLPVVLLVVGCFARWSAITAAPNTAPQTARLQNLP